MEVHVLDQEALSRAIRLQRTSYDLLRWFQSHVDRELVPFPIAHDALDEASAAKHWISIALPALSSGARTEPADVDALANMFASYLTTSFDLDDAPGTRLVSRCGCYCAICTHVEQAPHLRTKKVMPADKARARRMQLAVLRSLAGEIGRPLSDEQAEVLFTDPELAESVALVAYCEQLMLRLRGEAGDPSSLVLWRSFAWTRTGSPKKGFMLEVANVLDAERRLVEWLSRR